MVKNNDSLEDCKVCELVDELCKGSPSDTCQQMKDFLDTDPTPKQFIQKSMKLFGEDKTTKLMNRLSKDMGM